MDLGQVQRVRPITTPLELGLTRLPFIARGFSIWLHLTAGGQRSARAASDISTAALCLGDRIPIAFFIGSILFSIHCTRLSHSLLFLLALRVFLLFSFSFLLCSLTTLVSLVRILSRSRSPETGEFSLIPCVCVCLLDSSPFSFYFSC